MVTAGAPMPPHQANRDAQPWSRKSGGYSILAIDRPLEGLNDDPTFGQWMLTSDFFWNASSTCTLKVSDEAHGPALPGALTAEQDRAGKEGDWWSRKVLSRSSSHAACGS